MVFMPSSLSEFLGVNGPSDSGSYDLSCFSSRADNILRREALSAGMDTHLRRAASILCVGLFWYKVDDFMKVHHCASTKWMD